MLSASQIAKCYKDAGFLFSYKMVLIQFFIDAYLEIEKDVPEILQDSIWIILKLIDRDFEDFLITKERNCSILSIGENGLDVSDDRIIVKTLFGHNTLKELHEKFFYKTVLPCIEQIFQLRVSIKSNNEAIVKSVIEKVMALQMYSIK
jgi:hypothetical protein